ncbi:zinc ribbon domain-containing protein [Corynebacterium sp. 320]|uniref:FmdB family zinc ribbon protein n=1 Tax=Corynebacterium TaxID=1716 RepID=UPI00125CBB2B|nr:MULTISPECIES: FmdB family zinc ribbon protein [Corynebacterium]KAB1504090.1 zinc ribbon domain-containing protein [Corynebacterium sp. 320]KAB3528226.1 zinc ribbon domain-containing protein [Corynebacterium sp. 250]MCR5913851.1 zinc ribbon domain-containing protein [Corynebacterium sp. zg254]QNP91765.1 zinc ribbon domain-containing protein [Corynebacterium zhongnanshanii]
MPWYEFSCSEGHVTERPFSIAENKRSIECPTCTLPASRIISAPSTPRSNPVHSALITATKETAHTPDVVSSVPASGNRRPTPVSTNPLHRTLPRA